MNPPRHSLPSPWWLLRELVFLVRMRASERRFRRHDMAWQRHQAAGNRHLDAMAAEVEFRAGLCECRAETKEAARVSPSRSDTV